MRVFVPGERGARDAVRAAPPQHGVQVRHLRPERADARGRVRRRRSERSSVDADPRSGLSALRRRARAPARRAWLVIARAGIRALPREAGAFIGLLLVVVDAVRRPRRADLRRGEPAAGAVPRRRRPRCSAQFLEQQEIFVFFVTVYVGAGLIANDRRANALQIYLSKPLTRARVHLRQARDPDDVPAARHLGAGDRCCWSCRSAVRRQLHVPHAPTSSCSRRSRVFCVRPGAHRRRCAMLALSSLSKSSRYVGDALSPA